MYVRYDCRTKFVLYEEVGGGACLVQSRVRGFLFEWKLYRDVV